MTQLSKMFMQATCHFRRTGRYCITIGSMKGSSVQETGILGRGLESLGLPPSGGLADGLCRYIAEIDRQHQKFTAMLDMLFEAIEGGRSLSTLSEILQGLVAYAGYHFDTEEQLMVKHHYPEFGEHHKEHEAFRIKVAGFYKDFLAGDETLASDVVKFMTQWIADHVTNTDKKYGPFLNARGVF